MLTSARRLPLPKFSLPLSSLISVDYVSSESSSKRDFPYSFYFYIDFLFLSSFILENSTLLFYKNTVTLVSRLSLVTTSLYPFYDLITRSHPFSFYPRSRTHFRDRNGPLVVRCQSSLDLKYPKICASTPLRPSYPR